MEREGLSTLELAKQTTQWWTNEESNQVCFKADQSLCSKEPRGQTDSVFSEAQILFITAT